MPEVPWTALQRHLARNWRPGQHITLLGPTGGGKSHLALILADMSRYAVVVATKRRDPLLSELRGHGYALVDDLDEIPRADGVPIQNHVVVWPQGSGKSERLRQRAQAAKVAHTLELAERQGKWTVVLDETMWLSRNLALERELEALWFQGRSSGVSVVACAQRPSHVPLLALSQATYLFIWKVSDRRDIERLREISGGVSMQVIEENLHQLDFGRHEFLFVDCRGGHVARSVAPPR